MKPKKSYITIHPKTYVIDGTTYEMADPAAQNNMPTGRTVDCAIVWNFSTNAALYKNRAMHGIISCIV